MFYTMKKLFSFTLMCLMALSMNAQRCAVMEFRAGVGVSRSDVEGLCGMFTTGFQPSGYTMIERSQVDRIISEQHMQRSALTESQMVRIGQLLNLACIVIGDVNKVYGEYNVDVRVVNVESGVIIATAGKAFSGSYGDNMRSLARTLASKIAIKPGQSVAAQTISQSYSNNNIQQAQGPKTRSSVETVYGYLKVFPKELGDFSSEPITVIKQINAQSQYGYSNWRIPTNEELSLLRANDYLRRGASYMTRENGSGVVLLVSDGKSDATIKQDKYNQEQEQKRKEAEQLRSQGYVDLGLPSGTIWKSQCEYGLYTFSQAYRKYSNKLPTKSQFEELKSKCRWTCTGSGYNVVGPNGNSIFLAFNGYMNPRGERESTGSSGLYWCRESNPYWMLNIWSGNVDLVNCSEKFSYSVILIY